MKKFLIGLVAVALLSGCARGPVLIETYTVEWDELQQISQYDSDVWGWANWQNTPLGRECQIYIMDREWYPNDASFHRVWGHETRHCFEGSFHDGPTAGYLAE